MFSVVQQLNTVTAPVFDALTSNSVRKLIPPCWNRIRRVLINSWRAGGASGGS